MDIPPKGAPPIAERLKVQYVFRVAERLLAVVVDDGNEVGEPMVRGEYHRLPHGTLVQLRVAEEDEDPPRRSLQPRGQCGAGADRQSVSEGAGAEIHAGQLTFGVH